MRVKPPLPSKLSSPLASGPPLILYWLWCLLERSTAPPLTKMAENNLAKDFFLLVEQTEWVYVGVSQALKSMKWRGEGKCVVSRQAGEWKEEKERGGKNFVFQTLRTICQLSHSVGLCPKETKAKSATQQCAWASCLAHRSSLTKVSWIEVCTLSRGRFNNPVWASN